MGIAGGERRSDDVMIFVVDICINRVGALEEGSYLVNE